MNYFEQKYIEMKQIYKLRKYSRYQKYWGSARGVYIPYLNDSFQILRSDGGRNSWTTEGTFFSQCGQDRFVSMLFEDKSEGFFLDIGANHPTHINNTFFFEKKGWKGLAFEPLSGCCDEWKKQRKTPCLNIALGAENKEVLFQEISEDYLSRKSEIQSGASVEASITDGTSVVKEYMVQQRKLQDVLDEYGISEVDYVSLDVEGAEIEILESIDFNKTLFKVFSVENEDDLETVYRIRRFFYENGFWYIARLTQDDIFVNRSYFFKTE